MAELSDFGLSFNPFESAGSGAPIGNSELWMPERWLSHFNSFFDRMNRVEGAKAYAVLGEYGSGKSYILRWLEREKFPALRIRSFYFDTPGVQFYDLANYLLKQIGREPFAKMIWEFVSPSLSNSQSPLFNTNPFHSWLESVKRNRREKEAIDEIAKGVIQKGITSVEEIAYRFGMLVVQTLDKPYYEYRDFVAGKPGSLVAENEEAPYFSALIRALQLASNAGGVALLIDEFEDVSLNRKLTSRQSGDYLATLKRLYNLASDHDMWIILAMTPQAAEVTEKLQPALWERLANGEQSKFNIAPLTDDDVKKLLEHRLKGSRLDGWDNSSQVFPFPENIADLLRGDVKSNPRRLIKLASYTIATATQEEVSLPFTKEFIEKIQSEFFPQITKDSEKK